MADSVYIPDDGIKLALQELVASGGIWDGCKLRLFVNNITPSDASVIGDFTEAAAGFPGYAAITLSAATWGAVTVTAHVAQSFYGSTPTFTRSSTGTPQNVYGWYVTDAGNTKVYAAARFSAAPLTVTNTGDNIQITALVASTRSNL